jgi:hypothetical protein
MRENKQYLHVCCLIYRHKIMYVDSKPSFVSFHIKMLFLWLSVHNNLLCDFDLREHFDRLSLDHKSHSHSC